MGAEFADTFVTHPEISDAIAYAGKNFKHTPDMEMEKKQTPGDGDGEDLEIIGSDTAEEERVWEFLTNLELSSSAARTDADFPERSADDPQVASHDSENILNEHVDHKTVESSSPEVLFENQGRPSRSCQVDDELADGTDEATVSAEEENASCTKEDAIASPSNETPPLLEPSANVLEHTDSAPNSVPSSSTPLEPESEVSTSPPEVSTSPPEVSTSPPEVSTLPSAVSTSPSEVSTSPHIPDCLHQAEVPTNSPIPAPQPPPLTVQSNSFTMPIPKCLWCGTERQLDSDCCEWSILKGSSNQRSSVLRRSSSERIPRLGWDETHEKGGGVLEKIVSGISMNGRGGREGIMESGLKKHGVMAKLQRILSGIF